MSGVVEKDRDDGGKEMTHKQLEHFLAPTELRPANENDSPRDSTGESQETKARLAAPEDTQPTEGGSQRPCPQQRREQGHRTTPPNC